MARLVESKVVKFVDIRDLDGYTIDNWCADYLDKVGVLTIYESEHKAKGKKFVRFTLNGSNSDKQKYFQTSLGDLTEDTDMIFLRSNHEYVFKVDDNISNDYFKQF